MLVDATLIAAAFVAGALNAAAGGGSFLMLPALVFAGVPAVSANAKGTLALLPGYLSAAWGLRGDTVPPPGLSMRALVVLSLIGGSSRVLPHGAVSPQVKASLAHVLATVDLSCS